MSEMEMQGGQRSEQATRTARLSGRLMTALRNQVPAATVAERRRNPLAASEAEAYQILTEAWGWS